MYFLDTNVFLTPAHSYYSNAICPGYWNFILGLANGGKAAIIKKIKSELTVKGGHIKNWVQIRGSALAIPTPKGTGGSLKQLADWAYAGHYTEAAATEFLGKADSLLVAAAKAQGGTVVTLETSAPQATSKIKIPDACSHIGVNCIGLFNMLESEGANFQ